MVLQGAVSSCGQSIMHMCSKWPLCQGRTRDTASPYVSVAQGATHALQLELPDIMHQLKTMAYFFCLWSSVGRPFSWSGYCPFLSSHILPCFGSRPCCTCMPCHAMPCPATHFFLLSSLCSLAQSQADGHRSRLRRLLAQRSRLSDRAHRVGERQPTQDKGHIPCVLICASRQVGRNRPNSCKWIQGANGALHGHLMMSPSMSRTHESDRTSSHSHSSLYGPTARAPSRS